MKYTGFYDKYLLDLNKLLRQRKLLTLFAGLYKSKLLGSGVEFDRLRRYVPGDPIRYIEWRAFARTRKLFLKTFKEYKRLNIVFIVDSTLASLSSRRMFGFITGMFYVMDLFAFVSAAGKDTLSALFLQQKERFDFLPLRSASVFRRILHRKFLEILQTPSKTFEYVIDSLWYVDIFNKLADILKTNSLVIVLNASKLDYTNSIFKRVFGAFAQKYIVLWLNFYESVTKNNTFTSIVRPLFSFSGNGLVFDGVKEIKELTKVREKYYKDLEFSLSRWEIQAGSININYNILKQLIWILHH